jgi:broad specificity phosphatase PhoE
MNALEGTVVAVTHGGVTIDLLRTLLGDESLPALLLRDGIPACALTTIQINEPNHDQDMQVTAMAEIAV